MAGIKQIIKTKIRSCENICNKNKSADLFNQEKTAYVDQNRCSDTQLGFYRRRVNLA